MCLRLRRNREGAPDEASVEGRGPPLPLDNERLDLELRNRRDGDVEESLPSGVDEGINFDDDFERPLWKDTRGLDVGRAVSRDCGTGRDVVGDGEVGLESDADDSAGERFKDPGSCSAEFFALISGLGALEGFSLAARL